MYNGRAWLRIEYPDEKKYVESRVESCELVPSVALIGVSSHVSRDVV